MYGRRMSQDEIDLENRKAAAKDFKRWQRIVAAKKGWKVGDTRLTASLVKVERENQSTTIAGATINMHIVTIPYRMGRMGEWNSQAVHFQVKIWIDGNEKSGYVFSYSHGSMIRQWPTIREILFNFVQDALVGSESFRCYCDNTGSDPDSRQAYRTYQECVDIFDWFANNHIWETKLNEIAVILQEAENRGDDSETTWPRPETVDDDNVPF